MFSNKKAQERIDQLIEENDKLENKLSKILKAKNEMYDLPDVHDDEFLVKVMQLAVLGKTISRMSGDKPSLKFNAKTSVKNKGQIGAEIIDVKTGKVFAVVKLTGTEKKSTQVWDYWFEVNTATVWVGNSEIRVPKQMLKAFTWKVNDLITEYSELNKKDATKDLEKVFKSA